MKKTTDATPHLLHVTDRGVHLHWKIGATVEEIQSAGRACRAFAGRYLVHHPEGGVPMKHPLGWFRFGVDDDGNALVGGRVKTIEQP